MSHGNKEKFSCLGIQICVNWFKNRGHKVISHVHWSCLVSVVNGLFFKSIIVNYNASYHHMLSMSNVYLYGHLQICINWFKNREHKVNIRVHWS